MQKPVTTYELEMLSPAELRAKRLAREDLAFVRVPEPMPELNRFFYTACGGAWFWIERLPWTVEQWIAWLGTPGVETWILTVGGVPVGYCELETQPEATVQLAQFGLLPQFIGCGLGGHALTCAIERAWAMNARRVWVHTASRDHPHALANYRARGFRIFHEETGMMELPDTPPGPWPGAKGAPEIAVSFSGISGFLRAPQ